MNTNRFNQEQAQPEQTINRPLTKKLTLHKETLRTLSDQELQLVAGGESWYTCASCGCPPPPPRDSAKNSCFLTVCLRLCPVEQ
jgi:hypothetical protein